MTPVVFMHYGDRDYLPLSLKVAKEFNPGTPIYLLGDDENKKYGPQFITYFNYQGYRNKELKCLEKRFQYISNKPEHHKKLRFFGISRWFRLYEFMIQQDLEKCWYFDSDTFICSNLAESKEFFKEYDYTLINKISGCVFHINNIDVLKNYMIFVNNLFMDKGFLDEQKDLAKQAEEERKGYFLCDMTFWREFRKENYFSIGEAANIVSGKTFDPNINLDCANQYNIEPEWEMVEFYRKIIKRIFFINKKAYGYNLKLDKLIQFNTLNLSWMSLEAKQTILDKLYGNAT